MLDQLEDWCHGRSWLPRGLLLVWTFYLGVRYVLDPDYGCVFDALNLGIHEAGHLVFGFGGAFLVAAGGTLLQLAAPLASMVMFYRQPDYFAIAISGVWLATNLYGIGTYAGDAVEQALPRVTVGGGEATHDWAYMLSQLGLLSSDDAVAFLFRAGAFLAMWASLGAGAWMIWLMARNQRP